MAGNFLIKNISTDKLQGDKSALVEEYIYLLVEQLRYTLSNLSDENFSSAYLEGAKRLSCGQSSIEIKNDGIYLVGKVYLNGNEIGGGGDE